MSSENEKIAKEIIEYAISLANEEGQEDGKKIEAERKGLKIRLTTMFDAKD